MAEAKTETPLTLSEQYLLAKEEKQDVAVKAVEVEEVDNPATASKEVVEEVKETPVAEKSTESPPDSEKSSEAPPAAEESTEAPAVAAAESTEALPAAEESTEALPAVAAVEEVTETSAEDAPAAAAEETSETVEESSGDAEEEKPEIKLETAPADFRFPTTNQSRHCFTRYVEYHRCVAAKGDDAPECDKFAKYYRSLCPGEWVDRWNEQRENGTFPGPL